MGHHHHGHSHGHDHGHGHSHAHAPESFNLAFALAVGLNLAFTVTEAVYAIFANSMSLLADAGHNLGDVLGLLLAWGASWLLTRATTEKYSYGFKRPTILAAIANALLLLMTSAIIVYGSIEKLVYPHVVNEKIVIVVAAIGIFINGATALMFMSGRKHDLNIKAAFMHLAADALISLGVVIAGIVILYTGWMWLDPVVGLLIVVAILMGTWGLLRDSIDLIMDAVPHWVDQDGVRGYLTTIAGVEKVHDLHIWGMSTQAAALTAHLVMPRSQLEDADYKRIRHDLKEKFRIEHVTLQVEKGSDEHPCEQVC